MRQNSPLDLHGGALTGRLSRFVGRLQSLEKNTRKRKRKKKKKKQEERKTVNSRAIHRPRRDRQVL